MAAVDKIALILFELMLLGAIQSRTTESRLVSDTVYSAFVLNCQEDKERERGRGRGVYDYYLRHFLSVAWMINHFSTFLIAWSRDS